MRCTGKRRNGILPKLWSASFFHKCSYKYAGFGKRLLAYLIDIIIITAIVFVIKYLFFGLDEIMKTYSSNSSDLDVRKSYLDARNGVRDTSLIIWIIYSFIADASRMQGTIGKKILKIKVVDKLGNRISWGKSFARNILKILSAIPFSLGFIWVLFNKKRQGWHDMIAKTFIISR